MNKRPDGFHNIESVFYPIELMDCLEMRKTRNSSTHLTVKCLDSTTNLGSQDDNLIMRAYHLLKTDYPKIDNFNIFLYKRIPIFAGLGGGSSDCAYALKLINYMSELNLSAEQLNHYCQLLGADCSFFLQDKPKFVFSKGELSQNIDLSLKGYYLVLIKPQINISTATAYKNIKLKEHNFSLKDLNIKDIKQWKDCLTNDFEDYCFEKYPLLSQIKQYLYSIGALYSQMSGSGATIYGIFEKNVELNKQYFGNSTFIYSTYL